MAIVCLYVSESSGENVTIVLHLFLRFVGGGVGGRGEILAEQNVKNVNVIGQKPCGYQDVFFSLFFSSLFFFLNSPSQNISFSLFNLFNIPFHLILLLLPVIELFLLLSFFSLSLFLLWIINSSCRIYRSSPSPPPGGGIWQPSQNPAGLNHRLCLTID